MIANHNYILTRYSGENLLIRNQFSPLFIFTSTPSFDSINGWSGQTLKPMQLPYSNPKQGRVPCCQNMDGSCIRSGHGVRATTVWLNRIETVDTVLFSTDYCERVQAVWTLELAKYN